MNEDQNIQDSLAKKVEVKKTLRKLANTQNSQQIEFAESFDWPLTTPVWPEYIGGMEETQSDTTIVKESPLVSISVKDSEPVATTSSFTTVTFTPETAKDENVHKFKKFDWTDKKARRALVKMLSDNCSVIGPI